MRQGEYFAAVYGILRNPEGKILFQRRVNTGFNDGILQFPSGHMEGEETYFQALLREMKEEIGISFGEDDVKLVHVLHRICKGDRVYFDIFYEIKNFSGDIKNLEPNKCSELDFFDIENEDITFYNKDIIHLTEKNISLSEIIM